ncbi:hypothetical protein CNMCM8980_007932 [Aspergillus fumigatiaffinis]|uniref:Uncharacterized protein n=1 Tax=Aspergillus fumigatiaffinis TaxID=340414 RepID=A0A8H4M905_9EURO|nr:hypothetical protein CNMCM5878_006258 [Aspergillus fumigatiaffinis]KAF4232619.1 hypothetical protein CNMCM6805_009749 [Aspergillus fumigatiaffinis]KAF4235595.1 hypothetical protein CNMCM6457_002895 [Aspergillus fumigatiaffinis]KAF4247018.1 hypothetical protein CNMCM8980_007932 [Aspergillus fumigatiaffinis]
MAPVRRYLRISKYSVLECRIYLENPSDSRWLLDSRDPVLPRIFAAIRPLVLPKLREENERLFARKKGKPVKDVIAEDGFEVALFLRESRTRHSLLTRHKTFEGAGDTTDIPVIRSEGGGDRILVESDSEADTDLRDIPQANTSDANGKRRRGTDVQSPGGERTSKRQKETDSPLKELGADGDDKKLGFRTQYEGFNIYGWVLCLLVTRKGDKARTRPAASDTSRQALMEEWISTQAQGNLDED